MNEKDEMSYFVWYDESTQKTAAEKIREAMVAYTGRFALTPTLVLINSHDQTEVSGMVVQIEQTVQRNTFWLGIRGHIRA